MTMAGSGKKFECGFARLAHCNSEGQVAEELLLQYTVYSIQYSITSSNRTARTPHYTVSTGINVLYVDN